MILATLSRRLLGILMLVSRIDERGMRRSMDPRLGSSGSLSPAARTIEASNIARSTSAADFLAASPHSTVLEFSALS